MTVKPERSRGFGKSPENSFWEPKKCIAASIAFVAGMFAAAGLLGNSEIIFPEIAALAVGAWVMPRLPWEGRKINIWLSPTLAAATGILLIKIIPYNVFFLIALALVLVIVQLQLMHSGVFPAISAAILPILVHATSWLYPISVCVLTGLIYTVASIKAAGNTTGISTGNTSGKTALNPTEKKPAESSRQSRYWITILTGVLAVAGLAIFSGLTYILAPPLIVVFVELTQPNTRIRTKRFKVFLLIMLAAFSGAMWLYLIKHCLNLPLWVSSAFALTTVFFLYSWLDIQFPPAAALALLPSIIPPDKVWLYPFEVSLGCAVFVVLSVFWERKKCQLDSRREEF